MERKKKKMPICGEDSILDYELSEMLENLDTYAPEETVAKTRAKHTKQWLR